MKKILFLILFLAGISPVFKNNNLYMGCSQAYGQDDYSGVELVFCNAEDTFETQKLDMYTTKTITCDQISVDGDGKPPCEWVCTEEYTYTDSGEPDCAGVAGGFAYYDSCGCIGGTTGIDSCGGGTGGTGGGGSGGGGSGGSGGSSTTTPTKSGEPPITKTEFDKRSLIDYAAYHSSSKEYQVLTLSTGAKVMGTLTRFENDSNPPHIFYYFTPYSNGYDFIVGMYYKIPDKDPRLLTASSGNSITSTFSNGIDGFPESGSSIISNLFDLWGQPMTVTIEPNNSPITVINDVPLVMKTWYLDYDGDGYHSDTRQASTIPGSAWKGTTNGPDCNDNSYYKNIDCRPNWYLDVDGDGYDAGNQLSDTSPGTGWVKGISYGTDCDDTTYSSTNNCNPCTTKLVCGADFVIKDCKCVAKEYWYIDKDNDGWYGSKEEKTTLLAPSPDHKTISWGPDCDDNKGTGENVYKLNSCGVCAEEPANGKCPCKTSAADLKAMFPNNNNVKNLETLANMINKYATDLGIDSKKKLQHLLSQAGHETGGLNTLQVTENLKYSTASLIPKSYSKFTMDTTLEPNKLDANLYINNAEKLANAAMCCQYHNGDEASEDGWRYRGRGILQLTWKSNYEEFQAWYNNKYNSNLDFVNNPDLISNDDNLAVLSGMWFFKKKVLDVIKDFENKATVENVTKRINPKKKGLSDRQKIFDKANETINCTN